MKIQQVRTGIWLHTLDDYFYTALLVKKIEKEKNVIRAVKVTNKPSGGFILEMNFIAMQLETLDRLELLDGEKKLKFYEWMFDWIFETEQKRKIS